MAERMDGDGAHGWITFSFKAQLHPAPGRTRADRPLVKSGNQHFADDHDTDEIEIPGCFPTFFSFASSIRYLFTSS